MGERGSWFCNCVISSCINMLSMPLAVVLLLLLLLLVVWVDAGVARGEADTGLVLMGLPFYACTLSPEEYGLSQTWDEAVSGAGKTSLATPGSAAGWVQVCDRFC